MEALIASVVEKVGIDRATAEKSIGIILNLFHNEGPPDKVGALMNAFPGASDLMAQAQPEASAADAAPSPAGGLTGGSGSPGGLSGLIAGALGGGNPLMNTLGELQAQGLSVDQARQVGTEVASFAREKAGEDVVNDIAGSIPGLSGIL